MGKHEGADTPVLTEDKVADDQVTVDVNDDDAATALTAAEASANLNVKLALIFTFMSSAGRGVWAFATLSVYLQQLSGGTVAVGVAEGVQGLIQLVVAPIAGWAADSRRRDVILKVGGLVGILAAALLSATLLFGDKISPGGEGQWDWLTEKKRVTLMTIALGFWGAYQGVWNTSLETVFADSIPTGQRSQYNMTKFAVMQAANVTGPLLAIVLYLAIGGTKDDWSQSTVIWVFLGGVLGCVPAMLLLFLFDDKHMRGKAAAAHTEAPVQEKEEDTKGEPWYSPKKVPHIVIASNLVNGIGAGMTIKFFPLFFAKEIGLSPVATNAIYVGLPIMMVFAGKLAQRLSKTYGRTEVSITYIMIGSSALIALWAIGEFWPCHGREAKSDGDGSCHWPYHRFWYVMLPIYLISTAPHMTFPLTQSILMDYVPRHQRGRWNSLASVTRFGWSGSAMAGGFLVQKWGYGGSFLVTAVLQMVSAGILGLLLPLTTQEREVNAGEKAGLLAAGGRDAVVGDQHSVGGFSHTSAYASVVETIGGHLSPRSAPCDYGVFSSAGPCGSIGTDD
eukprot:Hpha_TRINITY_DN12025_c0_g2::TRINITY_DN12025_c0_g2_i1::g.141071::m.141071